MSYLTSATRQAYVAGVRDAVEASILNVGAPEARELCQWLSELEEWTEGDPPPGPHLWPSETDGS